MNYRYGWTLLLIVMLGSPVATPAQPAKQSDIDALKRALEAELTFYAEVFGIHLAGDLPPTALVRA